MFGIGSFFGGVGGDAAASLQQSAQSEAQSDFAGGGVTIEGLRVGGASDNTLLFLGAAALIILFLVVRK